MARSEKKHCRNSAGQKILMQQIAFRVRVHNILCFEEPHILLENKERDGYFQSIKLIQADRKTQIITLS